MTRSEQMAASSMDNDALLISDQDWHVDLSDFDEADEMDAPEGAEEMLAEMVAEGSL